MCWNLLRYILKQVQWSILFLLGKEDILFINKCWLNWNLSEKCSLSVWNGAMILGQKTALSEIRSVFVCQADYMLTLVCAFTKCCYHSHLTMWFCSYLYIDYVFVYPFRSGLRSCVVPRALFLLLNLKIRQDWTFKLGSRDSDRYC